MRGLTTCSAVIRIREHDTSLPAVWIGICWYSQTRGNFRPPTGFLLIISPGSQKPQNVRGKNILLKKAFPPSSPTNFKEARQNEALYTRGESIVAAADQGYICTCWPWGKLFGEIELSVLYTDEDLITIARGMRILERAREQRM